MFFPQLTTSKLPKSDCHPRYKSTSCRLSSISSTKNPTFQCSSFYELHFTYKFIYVFVLQFHDPHLVVQFMYIKSAFDQQIEQVSTHRISSFKTVSNSSCKLYSSLSYFKIVLSVWTGFFFIFNNFLIILNLVFNLFSKSFIHRRNDEEMDIRKVDRRKQ